MAPRRDLLLRCTACRERYEMGHGLLAVGDPCPKVGCSASSRKSRATLNWSAGRPNRLRIKSDTKGGVNGTRTRQHHSASGVSVSIGYAYDRLLRHVHERGGTDAKFQRLLQDYAREVYFAACEDAKEVLDDMTFSGVQARQNERREREKAEQ